jgi:hypothetical protein
MVDKQHAFHELATIVAGENAFASKIKIYGLKAFAVYDALFRWIIRIHFFNFDRSTRSSRISGGPLARRGPGIQADLAGFVPAEAALVSLPLAIVLRKPATPNAHRRRHGCVCGWRSLHAMAQSSEEDYRERNGRNGHQRIPAHFFARDPAINMKAVAQCSCGDRRSD